MIATTLTLLAQAEAEVKVSDKKDLYPHANELIFGAVAFAIIYVLMAKFVIPRMNTLLEDRRQKIQGEMERAEATRVEADTLLADYRAQLASARDEGNRIIEEARKTADQLRADLQAKAEQESQGIVSRAQEEIRGERDRVFQELRSQVGEIAVQLAGKVVGQSLDKSAHERLIDEYIDQVASGGNGSN
jgi:F-type H+-transporting ATPase subunit b